MNLLSVIEGMEAQGADPAAILQAVKAIAKSEALASAQIEDQRAQNRARQARWRNARKEAEKANVSITSHNVTNVSETSQASPLSSPLLPSPTPLTNNPPIIPPPEKKVARERASRIPENWALPADWRTWAESEAGPTGLKLSAQRVGIEGDRFRDFWLSKPGKDGEKLNWLATWRNWIRQTLDRQAEAAARSTAVAARFQPTDNGAAPQMELVLVDGKPTMQPVPRRAA